jgi:hypothetical protein
LRGREKRDVDVPFHMVRAASAGIDDASVHLMGGLCRHNIGSAAMTGIDEATGPQAVKTMPVDVGAQALEVWAGMAALRGPFVPDESQPAEVVFYLAGIFRAGALRVEVFYTK